MPTTEKQNSEGETVIVGAMDIPTAVLLALAVAAVASLSVGVVSTRAVAGGRVVVPIKMSIIRRHGSTGGSAWSEQRGLRRPSVPMPLFDWCVANQRLPS
mmetsp:Transcript_108250/g.316627  ORF Transcript_108250/g.316627 Transcript_108250/m.316627 type:complete len:100 (-) Transcript_108250:831-1130(-)